MSATHLDLPVLMSDEQIRRREFVVIRRGYDPAQVREFLERIADQVEQLGEMLRESRREADEATRTASQARTDPYAELADRVAGVLRAADEEADGVRREATQDAERILAEAREDADRIRADAEARAEEVRAEAQSALREAREHADRTLTGLSTKREAVVEQLAAMQERLVGVARELGSTIDLPEPDEIALVEAAASLESPLASLRQDMWASEPAPPPSGDEPEDEAPEAAEVPEPPGTIVLGEPDEHPMAGSEGEADEAGDDLDDEAQMALLDRAVEGLWDGTETIQLEVPDIPPLDLDWGDIPRDEGEER